MTNTLRHEPCRVDEGNDRMTVVERTEGAGRPPSTRGPGLGMPADATEKERAAARKQAKRRTLSRNWSLFLLFAGPNILLILAFIYYPDRKSTRLNSSH